MPPEFRAGRTIYNSRTLERYVILSRRLNHIIVNGDIKTIKIHAGMLIWWDVLEEN